MADQEVKKTENPELDSPKKAQKVSVVLLKPHVHQRQDYAKGDTIKGVLKTTADRLVERGIAKHS